MKRAIRTTASHSRSIRTAVASAFGRCRVSLRDPLLSERGVVSELTTD